MYAVLALYARRYNPKRPMLCIDEKTKQLIAHTRPPLPPKQGRLRKEDYEYRRHDTRNIFIAVEPKAGKRRTQATKHRKKADFAHFIAWLLRTIYADAEHIDIVVDNLNTHFAQSFVDTYGSVRAKQMLSRITFHYTPTHASWLNMAEIELSILERQCLKKRIADETALKRELSTWQRRRNRMNAKIIWSFTRQDADKKLGKHYI